MAEYDPEPLPLFWFVLTCHWCRGQVPCPKKRLSGNHGVMQFDRFFSFCIYIYIYITGIVSSVWAYFIHPVHHTCKTWKIGMYDVKRVSEFHVDFSVRKIENSLTHIKIFQSRDNLPPILFIICSDILLLHDNTSVLLFVSTAKYWIFKSYCLQNSSHGDP